MRLTASWLRLDLRRRWRSLAVLALLVAFATTTVLASVAGARRGDTAADRLLAQTLPATAVVLPNEPGFDWDQIRALPEVEALTTVPITAFAVEGIPNWELADSLPPTGDAEAMSTIERPVVLEGRLLNPDRVDEVVITAGLVEHYGVEVGDTVTLRMFKPRTLDENYDSAVAPPPDGPRLKARVVGVVRSVWYSDSLDMKGSLITSPALFERYRANLVGAKETVYLNALVRLQDGEAGLPAFRADLAEAAGRSDIDVWNMSDDVRHANDVLHFEALSLLAFGLAAMLAAIFLVGQSVARYTGATVAELQVLRAVGMSPRQVTTAAAAGPFLASIAGAALGVGGALVASRWMPIGAAALLEPDPGAQADWAVLAPGGLAVPLLVLAGAAAAAWFALAARSPASRPSTIATAAARAGLSVPVVVGTRFALEPGRGRTAVPVRPALLGAVTGVLGVVGAFTFSAGVSDAATNPERFGQTHQLNLWLGYNGRDGVPAGRVIGAVARDPDVASVNDGPVAVATSGRTSVSLYAYDPTGERPPVVLSAGRLPTGSDEVVLAPASAAALDAVVGSRVRLAGGRSGERPAAFTVTGIGFVPIGSHNSYEEGGWLTPTGYGRLFDGFKFHLAQIYLRPGASVEAVVPRLQRAGAAVSGGAPIEVMPADVPPQLAELRDVRVLPILLGGFLFLLAVGAVGHALATAVRRRRHDVAVMRALGMTRRQARGVVLTQASVLAAAGLAFGVPLGLALGRTLWRVVADSTPLAYEPPMAFWTLLLVGPVALLVANLLAVWPGHRAARLRVNQILRAE